MSSEDLHIPRERLSQEARLLHYAIVSLKEELDAVDWYRQRADDTEDEELKQVLLHNMREEMEHASMVLEWIRRRNSDFAGHLKLRDDQRSIGLLSVDNDDATYVSIDEATKMADVEVVYARSFYAGAKHTSGKWSGEIMAILAGPE